MFDMYFFIFLIEIFFAAILIVYIKLADEWTLKTTKQVLKHGAEIVGLIKSLREDLDRLNKIFRFIREFKTSNVRKIFLKTLDVINILMLFYPKGGKKVKAGRFIGIKLFKALFLALKSHP